jgi:hypothetical protein
MSPTPAIDSIGITSIAVYSYHLAGLDIDPACRRQAAFHEFLDIEVRHDFVLPLFCSFALSCFGA